MEQITPPPELNNYLNGEKPDFTVYTKRTFPLETPLAFFCGGIFTLIGLSVVIVPFLMGQDLSLTVDGAPLSGSINNIQPIIGPVIALGFFTILALGFIVFGLIFSLPNPAWYIGTPNRLVIFQKNKQRSIDWEQFSGNIEIKGKPEKQKITMELRTGKNRSRHGHQYFIPDRVYIWGIKDASQIEQILRQRIKENDPTPPQTQASAV